MKVAYKHPMLDDVIIVAAADMPHAVKKQANSLDLSGHQKKKRNLHLNGLPVQLRMGFDCYKMTPDYRSEGAIALYPKLEVGVFDKTSKSRMRFNRAARSMGQSMISCMENYGDQVWRASRRYSLVSATTGEEWVPPNTFDSYLLLSKHTDRFVDIMDGNNKDNKGC